MSGKGTPSILLLCFIGILLLQFTAAKKIGEACTATEDCADVTMECKNKVCSCKSADYVDESGSCKKKIATACDKEGDCIANADCAGKVCKCKAGFLNFLDKNVLCTKSVGDSCAPPANCGNPALECGTDNTCKCIGLSTGNKECKGLAGSKCMSNEQCVSNAECSGGICKCKANYNTHGENLCSKDLGAKCTGSDECGSESMTCSKAGICECNTGYTTEGNACRALSGTKCDFSTQCTEFSECIPGKDGTSRICDCKDQYRSDTSKKCTKSLATSCIENGECGSAVQKCFNKKCVCTDGYKPDTEASLCKAILDGACKADADCGDTNSMQCNAETKKCECKMGFTADEMQICKYNYLKPCKKSEDCQSPTMYCDPISNGLCLCMKDTHVYKDGMCKGFLSELCVGSDCFSDFSSCVGNETTMTCQCHEGYKPDGQQCKAPPNSPCDKANGCIDEHSACKNGSNETLSCLCDNDFPLNKDSMKCSGSVISLSLLAAAFVSALNLVAS